AEIVYAVPGHPLVGEATVPALLRAAREAGVPVRLVHGLSFVEPTLAALEIDILDGLQVLDALDVVASLFPKVNVDRPVLLGQVYNQLVASELKLTLMALYPDDQPAILVHGAGLPDERVERLALYEIDRSPHLGHLTSLFLPARPGVNDLTGLAETAAILRSPEGCPWDQEQTALSLRPGILEEACEVMEAIEQEDTEGMVEELGDLIFQVVMQAQIAAEDGAFNISDVIRGIDSKLKFRHPHVWGDLAVSGTSEVLVNWEALKEQEKAAKGLGDRPVSLLDNIPGALPSLTRAQKMQKRSAKVGFDWPALAGVYAKIGEELAELQAADGQPETQHEVGDLLFSVVNLARWYGVDAEIALRDANNRYQQRFQLVERLARDQNQEMQTLSIEALEALWQEAKRRLQ
ncbi:MAG: nucleoside triphosphate pyrophosphohydrolase, partial [Anaerolineales bacterium]|nr:nucleoside triphosphate pyrophosphohydrolase [Anaerolineales bacterium]